MSYPGRSLSPTKCFIADKETIKFTSIRLYKLYKNAPRNVKRCKKQFFFYLIRAKLTFTDSHYVYTRIIAEHIKLKLALIVDFATSTRERTSHGFYLWRPIV